jgi:site-specific recombinase XerC
VPHLNVSGKGEKTRYLPLHPGTNELIHDYLEAAGHGTDENGALFRPIRNNRTGRLDKALTNARRRVPVGAELLGGSGL